MHPLFGDEYEWFCCDQADHVAAVSIAGMGPMPSLVVDALDVSNRIRDFARGLPAGSGYKIHARDVFIERGGISTFLETGDRPIGADELTESRLESFTYFARRGIYIYDWCDIHRPGYACSERYELLAAPDNPILVGQFPEDVRWLIQKCRIEGALFQEQRLLDVKKYWACVE